MEDSRASARFAYASGLKAGDVVEVKGEADILKTLASDGTLDRLPFMPEMFAFCGQRFRVSHRADKTCDTVNRTGGRRMEATVHLEDVRCEGTAHGGCEASCLIFWKEAWLTKVSSGRAGRPVLSRMIEALVPQRQRFRDGNGTCSRDRIEAAVFQSAAERESDDPAYSCQATTLPEATELLPWWSPLQYFREIASGNVTVGTALRVLTLVAYRRLVKFGVGYRALVSLYDGFQRLRGGTPWPYVAGTCKTPPRDRLDVEPGEWVQIKSHQEILATVNQANRNRGLSFDPEMVPYCGKRVRVRKRVNKILDERTGRMIHLGNDCIILDGVVCTSNYSEKRVFCPRAIYSYWREVWLRRAEPGER